MTVLTVANQAQLRSAVASAMGGDTIVLKDGHYGSLRISDDFASNVTIRSEKPLGATVSNLEIFGASNLTFDGINFYSGGNGGHGRGIVSIERQAKNIAIVNSEVHGNADGNYNELGHYGFYVRGSDNIKLQGNDIHDVSCGIVVFGTTGSSLKGNTIDYIGHDAMKLGGLHHTEIVENRHLGHHYPQPATVHADFIQFQGSSDNVVIEGNIYLAQTTAWLQGIFANDGVYKNFTVENNIIHTGMMRGISFSEGSGIVIRNNTVLHTANDGHPETKIFAPGGSVVENNITGTKGAGGSWGSNVRLQNSKPGELYYVEDYFLNGAAGKGLDLADLQPVKGSLAESKGAAARLKELLGGEPAPERPTPAPEPVEPPPSQTGDELAINAGGGATGGFDKDAGFSGGAVYTTRAAIAGTTADAIYQSERFGNFKYGLEVENGTYDVTLKFAEIYHSAAGRRLFDVKAENKLVLDDLDIFRMAGGKNKAWDTTIEVEVTDGKLNLDFITVTNNAKISGIAIEPSVPTAPTPEPSTPIPAPTQKPVKINAGGVAANGFDKDAGFSGGNVYSTKAAIAGTTADALYQTERFGNFKYGLAVANGDYEVTLKFAEIHWGAAGKRIFDVKAEGELVLDDLDVFRIAGGKNKAWDTTIEVEVTDGKLDLDFISVNNHAKISAIEIAPVEAGHSALLLAGDFDLL